MCCSDVKVAQFHNAVRVEDVWKIYVNVEQFMKNINKSGCVAVRDKITGLATNWLFDPWTGFQFGMRDAL